MTVPERLLGRLLHHPFRHPCEKDACSLSCAHPYLPLKCLTSNLPHNPSLRNLIPLNLLVFGGLGILLCPQATKIPNPFNMSILFYRRPDYVAKVPGPMNLAQCQVYVERTQKHKRAIPPELSFENVIQNRALPVRSQGVECLSRTHSDRRSHVLYKILWIT